MGLVSGIPMVGTIGNKEKVARPDPPIRNGHFGVRFFFDGQCLPAGLATTPALSAQSERLFAYPPPKRLDCENYSVQITMPSARINPMRQAEHSNLQPTSPQSCRTCRHFAHQPCFVAGKYQLTEHCAKWYKTFPDASQCDQYEREPGSDDDT